jgi:hypothetical protein
MIYALSRDVVMAERPATGARLRDGKRPRPLVLRMNVGDTLEIRFLNLLREKGEGRDDCGGGIAGSEGDWPATTCAGLSVIGLPLAEATQGVPAKQQDASPKEVSFRFDAGGRGNAIENAGRIVPVRCEEDQPTAPDNNFARQGLLPQRPGQCRIYRFTADRPGPHLMLSHAAPAGGEGDGGSLTHGLFGVVVVERAGSRWYRSQVDEATLRAARAALGGRSAYLDYEAAGGDGTPLLNMGAITGEDTTEIVHSDLNAIVYCPLAERRSPPTLSGPDARSRAMADWHCATREMREALARDDTAQLEDGTPREEMWRGRPAHRAFAIVFHDELKTRYADPFTLLDPDIRRQKLGAARDDAGEPRGVMLDGIRDGFAINYGASGMGTILMANRLGIGPARDCAECLYEEFFLQSWANGDPALLTEEMADRLPQEVRAHARRYGDDPSNTHHSYIGDRVLFHNLHAGPKETHVFHLHAHQWRAGADGYGAYRDSQTIAPLQAFTYEIDHGGGGNLNLTAGDSIFHCHLYPHFAQGMWALWRNHDVLEDGSRTLPDGVLGPGTDPGTGEKRAGSPVPAVVPLPGQAMPPPPTYANDPEETARDRPGYPFFIAGRAGHRAPQPPMDIHEDGGLGRHRILGNGERRGPDLTAAILDGDFRMELTAVELELLPPEGDARERRAMAFHAAQNVDDPQNGEPPRVRNPVTGVPISARPATPILSGFGRIGAYLLPRPEHAGRQDWFRVNGRLPTPGAPFADPCRNTEGPEIPIAGGGNGGQHDPENPLSFSPKRVYQVSAVELDLVVNAAGWHDPQAHMNVLTSEADAVENRRLRAAPFFFRAHSGDCVEFRHQNRTKGHLELDDFQVATPTDTIGQHIHLVKFDVLASDGSANGWNYEDGTFARTALCERLRAANRRRDATGREKLPEPSHCTLDAPRETWRYQTTVQRWYADRVWQQVFAAGQERAPGSCEQDGWYRWRSGTAGGEAVQANPCRDATLRTVFTHDHFGPSSIQQHGFYSALLVEPEDSVWFTADGRPMCSRIEQMQDGIARDGCVMPVTQIFPPPEPEAGDPDAELVRSVRALWRPTAQALIVRAGGNGLTAAYHGDLREFPMAIADFALLYSPRREGSSEMTKRLGTRGSQQLREFRARHGWPIEAPKAPEAISQHHHNPFLVNYAHDPVPLRVGRSSGDQERLAGDGAEIALPWNRTTERMRLHCSQLRRDRSDGISRQRERDPQASRPEDHDPGDLSRVFDSWCHGDPFGELFEAYEGEQLQIRLIQGAQEVQHVFNAPSLRWRRDADLSVASTAAREVANRVAANQLRDGGTGVSSSGAAAPQRQQGAITRRSEIAQLGRRLLDNVGKPGAPSSGAGPLVGSVPREEVRDLIGQQRETFDLLRTGFVSAQEVGISEHFEFHTRGVDVSSGSAADHLWHFGSTDAIWNGAWGLIRLHNGTLRRNQGEWEKDWPREPETEEQWLRRIGTRRDDSDFVPWSTPDGTCMIRRAEAASRGSPEPGCDVSAVRGRLASLRAARLEAERAARDGVRAQPLLSLQATGDWRRRWEHQSPRVDFVGYDPIERQGEPQRVRAADNSCPAEVVWHAGFTPEGRTIWDWRPTQTRHYRVVAEPIQGTAAGEVFRLGGLRIVDPRPMRFRATGMRVEEGGSVMPAAVGPSRPAAENGYMPLMPPQDGPLVLRALAGECIHIELTYALPSEAFTQLPGEAALPNIVSLNTTRMSGSGVLRPSASVSLMPQLLHQNSLHGGLRIGLNEQVRGTKDKELFQQFARADARTVHYYWFAGRYVAATQGMLDSAGRTIAQRDEDGVRLAASSTPVLAGGRSKSGEDRAFVVAPFAEDYGGINLVSGGDPFFHPAHGLVGTLVIHEAHAALAGASSGYRKPANGAETRLRADGWAEASAQVWLPEGGVSLPSPEVRTYRDQTLVFRDGLNHWVRDGRVNRPVPDCRDCGDSYDRGDRAAGHRAEPFWARLGVPLMARRSDRPFLPLARPDGQAKTDLPPNLNMVVFPRRFWLDPGARTPRLQGLAGVELRLHIGHPAGRARQRVFSILGHDYRDGIYVQPQDSDGVASIDARRQAERAPWYGAPGVSLLGPGRMVNARILSPAPGRWLWRDGPAPMIASGIWGWLDVDQAPRR